MSKLKGTDIVILKSILKERGQWMEEQFVSRLTPELGQLYMNILATSWVPISEVAKLYAAAADIFFPLETERISCIGKMLAEKSFSGIYKAFLRNPTPKTVVERASIIWSAYHVKGKLQLLLVENYRATLLVSDYPELPQIMRKVFTGQLMALLELSGARAVKIVHAESNPNAWNWMISWEA